MTNSKSSDTDPTQMDHILTLQLPGYTTPSLNRLLGQHWTLLQKEKKRARLALLSSLHAMPADSSMPIIMRAVASLSSTNSATLTSSKTTTRKPSKSSSGKSKSKPVKKK
jgi:DNA-directed RNA polymerase specialized sigma24 family protein